MVTNVQVIMEEVVHSLQESFLALKNHFTPERKTDAGSNIAQLVIFAEHAVKVGWSFGERYSCANAGTGLWYTAWLHGDGSGVRAAVFLSRSAYDSVLDTRSLVSSTGNSSKQLQRGGKIIIIINYAPARNSPRTAIVLHVFVPMTAGETTGIAKVGFEGGEHC